MARDAAATRDAAPRRAGGGAGWGTSVAGSGDPKVKFVPSTQLFPHI